VHLLSHAVAAFCATLRAKHGFAVGHPEAHDALRALEALGPWDRERSRTALRLVCCSRPEEIAPFDRAFDDFFENEAPGAAQDAYRPRHTRPDRSEPPAPGGGEAPVSAPAGGPLDDGGAGSGGAEKKRRIADDDDDAPETMLAATLRARYSPAAARGALPSLAREPGPAMLDAAARTIAAARLGRSRRASATAQAGRFDARRTVRASLRTGGEVIVPRYRARPPRNPRFVVLVDGSRSMADHTAGIVDFARALCRKTERAAVFFFSTDVRDVTRAMRAGAGGGDLDDGTSEAWGGGTRIGASLASFLDEYGAKLLGPQTLVYVYSDGVDIGDEELLENAMREIARRSAGIVWLNPHAATPGYAPTARGMRAALRHVALFAPAGDAASFARVAARLRFTPLRSS
jgi:hypothetical protein